MNIGQRIKVKRNGGGQSYGTVTGTAKSIFDGGQMFLIAIDGLEGEYAVHPEALAEVKPRNKAPKEPKAKDQKTKEPKAKKPKTKRQKKTKQEP